MQVVGFRVDRRGKVKDYTTSFKEIEKKIIKMSVYLVLFNATGQVVYAGTITQGVQPIIDVLKDLAEPVAYAFMVKGFLKLMSGAETEGLKTIKYAVGGYIGIQWIPEVFKIIRGLSPVP